MPDRSGTAPPLNEYKVIFLRKRWLQTLLGGVNFSINGSVPLSVYLFQLWLLVLPAVIGVPCSIAMYFLDGSWWFQIISGAILFFNGLLLQFFSLRMRNKVGNFQKATKYGGLTEEEEVMIDDLWTPAGCAFLLPAKGNITNVILQLICSGVVNALASNFLSPNHIATDNVILKIVLIVFGWITICTSQHSLLAKTPPEPNQYRSYNAFGFQNYTRAFYCLILLILHSISSRVSQLESGNLTLHIIFVFLPIGWWFAMLPQVDVFFLWLTEQVLIYGLGGTAAITDSHLLWSSFLAGISFCACFPLYAFSKAGLGIGMAAFTGYFLSRSSISNLPFCKMDEKIQVILFSFTRKLVFFLDSGAAVAYGILGYVISEYLGINQAHASKDIRLVVLIILTVLWVLGCIWEEIQHPFLFHIVRNPFFPKAEAASTTTKESEGHTIFNLAGKINLVLSYLDPLVILFYLCITVPSQMGNSTGLQIVESIFVVRAFRWVWQSTSQSLLEVVILGWVREIIGSSAISDSPVPYAIQLFFTGVAIARAKEFAGKLFFFCIMMTTTAANKKLYFSQMKLVYALQILLFPLVLVVIAVCTILSAPLLPFLGLPLFIVGFPRPVRQWPTAGASYSGSSDSVYYQQLVPHLTKTLPKMIHSGFFGNALPGSMFLMRFESRIVWMEIIERGYGYTSLVIKGLELQETSCHHVEAGKVDEVFAHGSTTHDAAVDSTSIINKFIFHTLRPLGNMTVNTYTKSHVNMTGIIDHPDNLRLMTRTFYKTLTWVLRRNVPFQNNDKWKDMVGHYTDLDLHDQFPHDWLKFLQTKDNLPTGVPSVSPARSANSQQLGSVFNPSLIIHLAVTCYSLVEVLGLGGLDVVLSGAKHIYEVFGGSIPTSLESMWLEQDAVLRSLVVKAYRYAFKIMFDQVSMGESDISNEDLLETLNELEDKWYIGVEDQEFQQQLAQEKENLFSLSFADGTYFGNILRLQPNSLQIGELSSECVRGIWSSLNLELLYITNDDDERYSIQAHSTLLRNLTIQSSEPPLGYPCYAETYTL